MLNIKKIIIDPSCRFLYSSYYIKGLICLYGNDYIEYSIEPFKSIIDSKDKYRYDQYMAFVLYDNNNVNYNIVIDYRDDNSIKEDALSWSHIYAKINLRINNINIFDNEKIISIGPSFSIKTYSDNYFKSLFIGLKNYLITRDYYDVDFKNFMSGYLGRNRLPIEHYEPFGDLVENYFFFISTLWTHKNCVEHTNPWRHLYMTIIRDELKEMIFEGGFFSTSYNEETEKYSSFVLNDRIPISDYLKKTRMSAAVFNTPAVHMCHGWKLAEYMALGKAIISTPIINATPAELVHGVHLHIIESRDEMKEAILLINNNTEYRKKLEQGAYNYYKSYLSPEACINIIATKAEAIRNRLT